MTSGRQKITEAALSLFIEQGYAQTSVDEIAARAGVSKGLTYHHFSSKEDLLEEIIYLRLADQQSLVTALQKEPDPGKRLQLMLERLRADLTDDEAGQRFAITTYLHPAHKEIVARAMNKATDRFAALHQEECRMLADFGLADPETELPLFRAGIHGIAVLYLLNPDTYPLDAALRTFADRYVTSPTSRTRS